MQDWDDLRIFLGVARAEGLSRAAGQLKLDPSTLARRIARLEAATGSALFAKSPTGYSLTELGQRLFRRAESVEAAMDAASRALDGAGDDQSALSGQVRIGAPDGCASYLLPQVVADIGRLHPQLEMQIVALPRVFNLTRREADMAVAISIPTGSRVIARRIAEYRLVFAASEDYLRSAPKLESLSDLAEHRVVGYIPDMIFDPELDYLAPLGVDPRLASNSVPVQMNLLRQGAGVGVAHAFALPATPGLRRVLAEGFELKRTFHLIRHAEDRRHARQEALAKLIVAGLRREIAKLERLALAAEAPAAP